jgi:molybdate transport system ATP-binding protein
VIEVDVEHRQGGFDLSARFVAGPGVTALFGRSGAGKSTLLALVAGLARPARGRIALGGRALVDTAAGLYVPKHRRRVGVVFQDARLLPHLSVRRNLLFGRFFTARARRRIAIEPVIETLGIGHLLDRAPGTLSGGERQRIALGRALLMSPDLLCMDEPLAALDAPRRAEILPLIERVRDEFAIPILYVSHSVEEVARLAAEVVVLEEGRVVAAGPAGRALRLAPHSPSEHASVLEVTVGRYDAAYALTSLSHPAGAIAAPGRVGREGATARIVVHAADVALALRAPEGVTIRNALAARILAVDADEGPVARVALELDGGDALGALVTRRALDELGLRPGARCVALVKTAALAGG